MVRQRYPNLGISITRGPQSKINQACDGVYRWDDGMLRSRGDAVTGCFKPLTGEIFIVDSCSGAKALWHELSHADGKFGAEADAITWR